MVNLSVLMPAYNCSRFIASSISSILTQTFRDFEFIVVDDGSTDGTLDYLKSAQRADSRIILIHRENRGLVASLNEGLSHCNGRYIARMDGDDIAMPERFEKQVAYLDSNSHCVVVGTNWVDIDADGDVLSCPSKLVFSHDEIDRSHLNGFPIIRHPSVMMRSDALKQIGGYHDWSYAEDLDLWLRLAEIGKLANLGEVLLKYRVLTNSFTFKEANFEMMNRIIHAAYSRRGLPGEPPLRSQTKYDMSNASGFYAKRALRAKQWKTARKHALRNVRAFPFSRYAWTLLLNSVLKRA